LSTQEGTLTFGAAFPADDAVARWISSLAMAHNDLVQVHNLYVAQPDGGEGIFLVRLAAGHLAEIGDAKGPFGQGHDDWPEVVTFVGALPKAARDDFVALKDVLLDRSPDSFGWKVDQIRNRVFHYPHLHPGQSGGSRLELTRALRVNAGDEATVRVAGGTVGGVRLGFADELALWMTLDRVKALDRASMATFVREVVDAQVRFLRFGQIALSRYFARLPARTVTITTSSSP